VTTDLRHATGALPTSRRPVVMGVLNVTPDSFSDGGRALGADGSPDRAIALGLAMVADGADCVDVGGESTRPGASPVAVDDERARVVPVVAGLVAHGVVVSIDTRRTAVARAALDAGASLVNDVGALAPDEGMLAAVATAGVEAELRTAVDAARAAGIASDALAIDPGIGFGKTLEHNLALLRALPRLCALGPPVLVGTSRKSFLGRLTGVASPSDRLAGSLASAVLAARDGARILRVHDVAAMVEALAVQQAIDAAVDAGQRDPESRRR